MAVDGDTRGQSAALAAAPVAFEHKLQYRDIIIGGQTVPKLVFA